MRYADAPARRQDLLDRLAAHGYVSSADVAAELGVSEMTIRRDLRRLAEEGLARRVPGGASLPGSAGGEPFEARRESATDAKRAIARAAAGLLGDAAWVALDAGTTVAGITEFLPPAVSVVTHSLPVIIACGPGDRRELVALGGFYEPITRSFTGPATWSAARDLSVDVAVVSCTGVDERGLYSANPVDAEIKRALLESADRVVVLADRHKLGTRASVRFATPAAVDVLVTDAPPAAGTGKLDALASWPYPEVVRADG